ncbi:MAG: M24 family metallopeptidase [Chthonomonadales bacterium]
MSAPSNSQSTAAECRRVELLQRRIRTTGCALAIIAPTDNMKYLLGWAEPPHERFMALFVPADGTPILVVPALNLEDALSAVQCVADVRGWDDAHGWEPLAAEILRAIPATARVIVDDELPSGHLMRLQRLAPSVEWGSSAPVLSSLRQVKAPDEIEKLEVSARVTDGVCAAALQGLQDGIAELELQEEIRRAYLQRGVEPGFAIVCFGSNTALPHHRSSQRRLAEGDIVLLDIGCVREGYWSDITRTAAYGGADPEAAKVYSIVRSAYQAAFEAVRPGVPCERVDAAARHVIEQAGYGPAFIHRTGHGIGMSGHEAPFIVAGNRELLEEGMAFSIEPGIYLPGRFGIRVENIVVVRSSGAVSLNADPPAELPVIEP